MEKVKKFEHTNTAKGGKDMKACPLIRKSYKECYCMDMSSITICDAIYYCGEHHNLCPIYKEKMADPQEKIKLIELFKKAGQK